MISHFFIDRPIFAAVLSIAITLAGGLALLALPVAQYPPITPPTVQVTCAYPGASASVVADTVAAPIEQQVNGVENMLYMSSQSGNDGTYNLTVTFDLGTDLNTALVLVQNRVSLALPQLPDVIQKQGVTVRKKSPNILLVVNLVSPGGRYDSIYLSNYATIHLKDELARLPGVGDIGYLGQRDYAVRVWLDPDQLAARKLAATEVVQAIQAQNQPVTAGQVGQPPAGSAQDAQLPVSAVGQLPDADDFGAIIVKAEPGGEHSAAARLVRLRDVARVELGAKSYDQYCTLDGDPSVALAVYQLPDANALATAGRVKAKMEQLKERFPAGVDYHIVYDTTPFIRESVVDVVKTLRDAIILVAAVVLAFLQNWRSALIPLVAVPVAIVGTFAAMAVFGFSLNNISLFGLVLAIGIVVDDAIVVVENVERWLEEGLPPREAARRAMDEVTGPVVAVALVLCAVFIPCAFITGITGQFFRQFALTIAVSTLISAFNSLTLSPALAALLLRPHGAKRDPLAWLLHVALGWFFKAFNWTFARGTGGYTWGVARLLRVSAVVLVVYGGLLALTYWCFDKAPVGYIPFQDKGWLLVNVQLPDSASVQRTQEVMKQVEEIARNTPGVAHTITSSGQSILLSVNAPNYGSMFIILDPFDKRTTPELNGFRIFFGLRDEYAKKVRDARVNIFPAPPVDGLGVAGGFKLMVEDRASLGPAQLQRQADILIAKGKASPEIAGMFTLYRADTPQLYADIDRTKARSLGVPFEDISQTLQIYLGSLYVNNFSDFGRTWQVQVQADARFRDRVEDVGRLMVRNAKGDMVPLATLVDVRDAGGPSMVTRYNMYAAAPVNGNVAPGASTGEAIDLLDGIAERDLARTTRTEWTELTFMQIKAGNTAMIVFALAVVFVFLVLAALYESWTLPLAVILVVPMCLLCSVAAVLVVPHMDVNIFTQIGFVVLVGLASKNAILIVEFAKAKREEGQPAREATLEACRLRLRPILMTSFAFILGVVPLVLAHGAGSEMRKTLGVAVFSGMLGVTVFGVFLTPVFFHVIEGIGEAPLFASRGMRIAGFVLLMLLNILFLGLPALLGYVFRIVRRKRAPVPVPVPSTAIREAPP
jgi:hydrophobe/amphiphile efflux-1 (HAE1) family protein